MVKKEQIAFPLRVIHIKKETADAKSISLLIPNELKEKFQYRPGQFISVIVGTNPGEELIRSYSLCTSPDTDSDFKIMVKEIPQGKVSPILCHTLQEGQSLWCTPPNGKFFQDTEQSFHYVLLGAGSGITPLISILKHVLKSKDKSRVTLIYCNRRQDSIIFLEELKNLEHQYGERLQVIHIISQPQPGWEGEKGRLNPSLLRKFIEDILSSPSRPPLHLQCYLCGPAEFMNENRKLLLEMNIPPDQIRSENFATPAKPIFLNSIVEGFQKDGSVIIGESPFEKEEPEIIQASYDDQEVEAEASEDTNILESLLNAGHNPPYSCMSGACMACMASLEEGCIIQEDPGILTEENIRNREILTCQAKPRSRKVKLRFSL